MECRIYLGRKMMDYNANLYHVLYEGGNTDQKMKEKELGHFRDVNMDFL